MWTMRAHCGFWAAMLAFAAAVPQYGEPVANPAELEQHRLPKCVIPSMYRDKYAPCTLEGTPSDCGDKTPQGATKWQLYGLTAIYVDVDTKRCGFKGIPVYLTSIDGGPRGGHWQLTATDSIYRANSQKFRVVVSHPHIKSDELWRHAMGYKWSISWIGVTGKHAGVTHPGHTKWVQHTPRSLFVDVDTVPAGFDATPFYFTSLMGRKNHWKLTGQHEIYSPQSGSFRIYVRDRNPITPALANSYGWVVAWAGMTGSMWRVEFGELAERLGHRHVGSQGRHRQRWLCGDASVRHLVALDAGRAYADHGERCWYALQPQAQLVSTVPGQRQRGRNGSHALADPHVARQLLRVRTTQDCAVTPWGGWTTCDKTCGGGHRTRARTVTTQPFGKSAKPCPTLMMQQPCSSAVCPTPSPTPKPTPAPTPSPTPPKIDCAVSAWGAWSKCSVRCGGGTQSQSRTVTRKPNARGAPCPVLKRKRTCHTQQCTGVGDSRLCGATTDVDLMRWKPFGSDGLYVDVFTSHCKFAHTPQYACSMLGDASHWSLSGTNAISLESKTMFRVIVIHPKLPMRSCLLRRKIIWRVSWVADAGRCRGYKCQPHYVVLEPGGLAVGVHRCEDGSEHVRRNTALFHRYPRTGPPLPRGGCAHCALATAKGFRVFVCLVRRSHPSWRISGSGPLVGSASRLTTRCRRSHDMWRRHKWQGLYMNVDTSKSAFRVLPSYATSVSNAPALACVGCRVHF